MIKRKLIWSKLKPTCIEDYKYHHQNVWPKLECVYREAGIRHISCFLKGVDLMVYLEYDAEHLNKRQEWLAQNEVEIEWQKLMDSFKDSNSKPVYLEQVYEMK